MSTVQSTTNWLITKWRYSFRSDMSGSVSRDKCSLNSVGQVLPLSQLWWYHWPLIRLSCYRFLWGHRSSFVWGSPKYFHLKLMHVQKTKIQSHSQAASGCKTVYIFGGTQCSRQYPTPVSLRCLFVSSSRRDEQDQVWRLPQWNHLWHCCCY